MEEVEFTTMSFHYAVWNGKVDLLTNLLHKGALVNARFGNGQTALHLACKSEENVAQSVTDVLLSWGAEVNARDSIEGTPLHIACRKKYQSVVFTLLRNGADVDVVNLDFETPLHVVVGHPNISLDDRLALVNALLVNYTAEDSEDKSFQHLTDHPEGDRTVRVINQQDRWGNTALHIASANNYKDVVCLLLRRGAKVEVKNSCGMTAFIMAVKSFHPTLEDLLGVLVDNGADVNAQDCYGNTSLCIASLNKNIEVVRLLLRMGAKVGIKNNEGTTALHVAVRSCAKDIVYGLVDSGASVSAKDFQGNTPLHFCSYKYGKYSATSGWREIVSFLIINGAQVNEQNTKGITPLKVILNRCLQVGTKKIVEELIIQQVIRLKMLRLQDTFNIKWDLEADFYDKVRAECHQEIEDMKSVEVVTNISLYQVLSHTNQSFLLSNDDLPHIDKFLCSPDLLTRFPHYGNTLRITYERARLLTLAVNSSYSEQRKQLLKKLPCEVAEHLLTFLSNKDLRSFITSENLSVCTLL